MRVYFLGLLRWVVNKLSVYILWAYFSSGELDEQRKWGGFYNFHTYVIRAWYITVQLTNHITVNLMFFMLNSCLFYSVTMYFSSTLIYACSYARKRHFCPPLRHFITKQSWYSLSGDIFFHAISMEMFSIWSPGMEGINQKKSSIPYWTKKWKRKGG